MIELQINELKGKIVSFSYHVEMMLQKCVQGLLEHDVEMLNEVIEILEKQANKLDDKIEKIGISAIAQYSPKALNLRLVLMILKMNKDLERMADHCVNISYNAKDIFELDYSKQKFFDLIAEMSVETKKMLSNSIKSFIYEDSELAASVTERDQKVNKYQTELTKYFLDKMKTKPESVESSFYFIKIVNNLERIADLSTNIAEDVVFIFEGKNIKH